MLDPDQLKAELDSDEPLTAQRLKRLREPIREHTGTVVPRAIAGVLPWYRDHKSVISRKLNEATGDADPGDADEEES